MQNKEYANTFAINQSALKDFRFKSPKRWKGIWIDRQEDGDKNEEGFTFGSLMDTMMFTPEELDQRFYIGNTKLPSKAIESIVRSCYDRIIRENAEIITVTADDFPDEPTLLPLNLEENPDFILTACDEYQESPDKEKGWNKGWKADTRITKIIKDGSDYFESLVHCNGRKIITSEINFKAIELQDILLADPDTKMYFIEDEGVELKFQFEIFVNHQSQEGIEIPLKGALDILRIDHKTKTLQVVDFKTSYSAHDFVNSVKKYGYATQLSFYDHLLRLWLEQDECKEVYCDYTILNPINIVIDEYDRVPYIYEYSWTDLGLEREGNEKYLSDVYTPSHNHKIKKGWLQILETICWHYSNELWEKPKELYENRKIKINLLNS